MIKNSPFHYSIGTRVRNSYLLKFLQPKRGDRILDVGCGVGYFADLLTEKGAEVWGVDLDRDSIRVARLVLSERVKFASAESLPFDDNSFDKILCSEVLEHISDDKKAIREILRVVKPGGRILITVPSPNGLFGNKIKRICHENDKGTERHVRDGYSKEEIIALLERCGARVEKSYYTMVFIVELIMGLTKLIYSLKSSEKNLNSQASVYAIKDSFLLKVCRTIFPVLILFAKCEDTLLSPIIKGHMIILNIIKD